MAGKAEMHGGCHGCWQRCRRWLLCSSGAVHSQHDSSFPTKSSSASASFALAACLDAALPSPPRRTAHSRPPLPPSPACPHRPWRLGLSGAWIQLTLAGNDAGSAAGLSAGSLPGSCLDERACDWPTGGNGCGCGMAVFDSLRKLSARVYTYFELLAQTDANADAARGAGAGGSRRSRDGLVLPLGGAADPIQLGSSRLGVAICRTHTSSSTLSSETRAWESHACCYSSRTSGSSQSMI